MTSPSERLEGTVDPKLLEILVCPLTKGPLELDAARQSGQPVSADMYPYEAGGTGLSITVPNWVFADGEEKGFERLKDSTVRQRLKREVAAGSQPGWSNLVQASGGWDHVVLANPFNPKWEADRSRSIGEIANRNLGPERTRPRCGRPGPASAATRRRP